MTDVLSSLYIHYIYIYIYIYIYKGIFLNLFHNQKSNWSLVTGPFCCCIVKCAISDSNKYVGITPDKYLNHVINGAKKSKELFRDLLDNDRINKDEYDKICPKGSRPGIFYGNLKIYKPVPKF